MKILAKPEQSDPVVGRTCGDCRVCCKTFRVDPAKDDDDGKRLEFYKAKNEWCPEITESGCGIYEKRPLGCRYFRCAWLEGFFPDGWRPDKSKVVTVIEDHHKYGRQFVVYEQWPGVARSGKGRKTVDYLVGGVTVGGTRLPVLITDNSDNTPNEFISWDGWEPIMVPHADPRDSFHIKKEDWDVDEGCEVDLSRELPGPGSARVPDRGRKRGR